MTPCPFCGHMASPPADVQRPTTPLTDEELTALVERIGRHERSDCLPDDISLRLIADLRAARAEMERLREELAVADDAVIAVLAEVAERAGHPVVAARLDKPAF